MGTAFFGSGAGARATARPVLPLYKRPRSRLEQVIKYGGFLALCMFVGLFYGFAFALLPPQLMLYLTAPILLLGLLVIWALPDTGRGPVRLLASLFFGYIAVLVLWPNYLALQLPGLPWISLRRLFLFPMFLILLICLSVSRRFRSELTDVLRASRPLVTMIVVLTIIQAATMIFGRSPFFSLNQLTNYWLGATAVFFVGAWILSRTDQSIRFDNWMIGTALIICAIGALEFQNQGVLWQNYIPSFLAVQDEAVQRMLTATIRDGKYRVTTTFSVSLAMAEYLALVTPFVLHRIFSTGMLNRIVVWVIVDLGLLAIIVSTQSRLGIVGWIAAHAVYVCLWAFRRWRTHRSDMIAPALSLFYPLGAVLFFVAMFTVPAVHNRTIGGGSTGFSDQARQVQFDLLWPKLLANPFGYGTGLSGEVLGYRLPGGLLTVDSYFITSVLEWGVIGSALFFGLFVYAAAKMIAVSWRYRSPEIDLAMPLACALIVALQVRLVLSQIDNLPLLYMLLGMAAALAWRARSFDQDQKSTDAAAETAAAVATSTSPRAVTA